MRQSIGLLCVKPPDLKWVVPFPKEIATPEFLRFKRNLFQNKLNSVTEKWAVQGPICPEHKIPSEQTTFEKDGITLRGWKCSHCDFEIVHPLDANLSLFLKKCGHLKVRASNVGGQIVLRLPRIVASRYGVREGLEYEIDVTQLDSISVKSSQRTTQVGPLHFRMKRATSLSKKK